MINLIGFGSPGSLLGSSGQPSPDPIEALFESRSSPDAAIPRWVYCPARRSSPGQLGQQRCKNVLCPKCHSEQQRLLRRRLASCFHEARGQRNHLAWVTLTRPHGRHEALQVGLAAIRDMWSRARDGSPWRRLKDRYGLLGIITVLEIVWSESGWNPHFHAVVEAKGSQAKAESCAGALAGRFKNAVERMCIDPSNAADFDLVHDPEGLAAYLSKPWFKPSKEDGGWPPLYLLQQALAGCDASAMRFLEVADAIAGKRRVTYSAAFRPLLVPTSAGFVHKSRGT